MWVGSEIEAALFVLGYLTVVCTLGYWLWRLNQKFPLWALAAQLAQMVCLGLVAFWFFYAGNNSDQSGDLFGAAGAIMLIIPLLIAVLISLLAMIIAYGLKYMARHSNWQSKP